MLRPASDQFPELSYASPAQSPLRRAIIRSVEGVSGRGRLSRLYAIWRGEVADGKRAIFARVLDLSGIRLEPIGIWPPATIPETPLVIVANHPFGIGDGIAILALAEKLGRPFKVMLHKDLLKLPEIRPFALPVDFSETKEAVRTNLTTRREAVDALKAGTTIVIFPAGGVATARKVLGTAEDLPWKMFVSRLVQDAKASVVPINFAGQNGPLFHLVSKPMHLAESGIPLKRAVGSLSLTLRLSLLIREFAKLRGKTIRARIGETLRWSDLASIQDRKLLLKTLQTAVLALEIPDPVSSRRHWRSPIARLRRPARAA